MIPGTWLKAKGGGGNETESKGQNQLGFSSIYKQKHHNMMPSLAVVSMPKLHYDQLQGLK